ncbi:PIN domain-containing protein [Acidobacteria bacterium AH-259-D05]|nr:PIN domain-containing protein [Acidobacteria bacterium AH-259-D05]
MAPNILVDSSAWICYLRPQGWKNIKRDLKRAFARQQVYTCWVVKAEILIGARDEAAFEQLLSSFGVIPEVPFTERVWKEAARLGYTLRRHGITVPLPDLLIAQAAIDKDLVLWHVDEDFEQVRQLTSLRTRSFLER